MLFVASVAASVRILFAWNWQRPNGITPRGLLRTPRPADADRLTVIGPVPSALPKVRCCCFVTLTATVIAHMVSVAEVHAAPVFTLEHDSLVVTSDAVSGVANGALLLICRRATFVDLAG